MKKVYCKNCKHWYEWRGVYEIINDDFCDYKIFHKNKKASEITGQERGSFENIDAYKTNKNNTCPYYKRRWWKFWVR